MRGGSFWQKLTKGLKKWGKNSVERKKNRREDMFLQK